MRFIMVKAILVLAFFGIIFSINSICEAKEKKEEDFQLKEQSWQHIFLEKKPVFQVNLKNGAFKIQPGYISNGWYRVDEDNIVRFSPYKGWERGMNPFTDKNRDGKQNIQDEIPEFKIQGPYSEFDPKDDKSVWAGGPNKRVISSIVATITSLLLDERDPYSPENPNPETLQKESPYYVKNTHWQILVAGYETGDWFTETKVYQKDGGLESKTKFCQLINNPGDNPEKLVREYPWKAEPFHHGYALVDNNWERGQPPLNLSKKFPEYPFTDEFDPGDSKTAWTALIAAPTTPEEPRHTPDNPRLDCGRNTPPDDGWEVKKYWGNYFYQIDLRDDGHFKIKLNSWSGKEIISFDCLKPVIPRNWEQGQMPFPVQQLEGWFPGIHFETGAPPEGTNKTVWAGGLSIN